jgi:sugar phosphate isomerase/epimerase
MQSAHHTRRNFLRTSSTALIAGALLPALTTAASASEKPLFSSMGIAAPLEKAAMLKQAGAQFLTENTGSFLVPDKSDAEFAKNLEKLAKSPLPVLACNGFIRPADLICVGPQANHDRVLEWADTCFRRLKQAKGKFIVFGSSGARKIPTGWSREKTDQQFVALLKKMGPLAGAQGVTLVVEQLQKKECNYINRISEGAAIIRQVANPNVRLLADLYHMAVMGDTPADLTAAMDVVVHIEIAEKEDRTVPGISGDDFRPWFQVLRENGYHGAINIEGRWQDDQIAAAFDEIKKQSAES